MHTPNLYKRGEYYWYDKMLNGRRRRVSLGVKTLEDAVARLTDPVFRADTGVVLPGDRRRKSVREVGAASVTLSEMLSAMVHYHQRAAIRSPETIRGEKWAHDKLVKFVGKTLPVSAFTHTKAKEFLEWAKGQNTRTGEELSPVSIQFLHRALHSFFSWLAKHHPEVAPAKGNPFKGIELPEDGERIRDKPFCTVEIRNHLINSCEDDDLKFVLYCGFHCGLRRREICEARVDWFHTGRGYMQVKKAICAPRLRSIHEKPYHIKNRNERSIPLTPEFSQFLDKYLKGKKPLDFALKPKVYHGKSAYRYDFRKPYEEYMETMEVEWVTHHTMRHTFASLKAQAGIPMIKIARWLGDTLEVTDKNYTIIAPNDPDFLRDHLEQ